MPSLSTLRSTAASPLWGPRTTSNSRTSTCTCVGARRVSSDSQPRRKKNIAAIVMAGLLLATAATNSNPSGPTASTISFSTIIPHANALTQQEVATIASCVYAGPQDPFKLMYDYENAAIFNFGHLSFAPISGVTISSFSQCSKPHGSHAGNVDRVGALATSHFMFGLGGSDHVAICVDNAVWCKQYIATGFKPYRHAATKREMMALLRSAAGSLMAINKDATGAVSPNTAIYSPMTTSAVFIDALKTVDSSKTVSVDIELQESFFNKVYNTDTTANIFSIEFALSASNSCSDADTNAKMTVTGPTYPQAGYLQVTRTSTSGGPYTAKVVRLTSVVPKIAAEFFSEFAIPYFGIAVCARITSKKYSNTPQPNGEYRQWFALPQFTGVPYHTIIATTDRDANGNGRLWTDTFMPMVTNTNYNWDITDLTQEARLTALKAAYPTIYTPAFLSIPRTNTPDLSIPLIGNNWRVFIQKVIIDSTPFRAFVLDASLDPCNAQIGGAGFTITDLRTHNTTHYYVDVVGRAPVPAGGAEVSLCGAATFSNFFFPLSLKTKKVKRCMFGQGYDGSQCYSCTPRDGDWAVCGGHGTCGRVPVGLEEFTGNCKCNATWDPASHCTVHTWGKTKTANITATRTRLPPDTLSKTLPDNTRTIADTRTVAITPTTSQSITRLPQVTCYFTEDYAPTLQRIDQSLGSAFTTAGGKIVPVRAVACTEANGDPFCDRYQLPSPAITAVVARYFVPYTVMITDATESLAYSANIIAAIMAGLMAVVCYMAITAAKMTPRDEQYYAALAAAVGGDNNGIGGVGRNGQLAIAANGPSGNPSFADNNVAADGGFYDMRDGGDRQQRRPRRNEGRGKNNRRQSVASMGGGGGGNESDGAAFGQNDNDDTHNAVTPRDRPLRNNRARRHSSRAGRR